MTLAPAVCCRRVTLNTDTMTHETALLLYCYWICICLLMA